MRIRCERTASLGWPVSGRLIIVSAFTIACFVLIATSFAYSPTARAGSIFREFRTPTQNSSPAGVTMANDGTLWFVETKGNRLGSIPPSASAVSESPVLHNLNSGPLNIASDKNGDLWFTEQTGNRIGRMTQSTGAVLEFNLGARANPWGIALDDSGNAWFTEAGFIGEMTPTGPVTVKVTERPLAGTGSPQGIALGPDGNIWFAHPGANTIGTVTSQGIVQYTIPTLNSQPQGVTTGRDGNVWFTEFAANKIGRINPLTTTITEFPLPLGSTGPAGIVSAPDGSLWYSENPPGSYARVGHITQTGSITEYWPLTLGRNFGITTGGGFVWITEAGGLIGRFAVETPTSTSRFDEFAVPHGAIPSDIVQGPDGNLWFTEQTAGAIGRITPTGVVTHFPQSPQLPFVISAVPYGITQGQKGTKTLWFTERNARKIGRIDLSGAVPVIAEFPLPTGLVVGGCGAPEELVWGPDGGVWFTNATTGNCLDQLLGRFDPVTHHFSWVPLRTCANAITVGTDSKVWFTEAFCRTTEPQQGIGIGTWDPNPITAKPKPTYFDVSLAGSGFEAMHRFASGIRMGPDGNIWFTSPGITTGIKGVNSVGRLVPTGATFTFFGLTGSDPRGMTMGGDGNLWFTETGNGGRIGRIAFIGGVESQIDDSFQLPTAQNAGVPLGVATDLEGNVWFTDSRVGANSIGRLTPPGKADQTITFGALQPKTFGDAPFNVSASSTSGLPVSFGAIGYCTMAGSLVTITAGGTCTIIASQAGNAIFNRAPDVGQTFTVGKAPQTISFAALSNKTFGDAPFSVSASASSGLAISFSAGGNCTVVGTVVTITGAGTCTITASQAGNTNYNPAPPVPQTFSIANRTTSQDIGLTLVAGPLTSGSQGVYLAIVTNTGTAATSTNLTFTDKLPAGLTYAGNFSSGWTCSVSAQTVTCAYAHALPAQDLAGVALVVHVTAAAGTVITNTGTVSPLDSTPSDNTASATVTVR